MGRFPKMPPVPRHPGRSGRWKLLVRCSSSCRVATSFQSSHKGLSDSPQLMPKHSQRRRYHQRPGSHTQSSCDGGRPKPRHDRRPRVPAHSLRFPSRQPDQTGQDGAKKRRQAVAALTHLPKRASRKTAWTCPQRKTSSVALKTPSVAVKMSSAAVDTKTRRG
jgi:hypothetical protein